MKRNILVSLAIVAFAAAMMFNPETATAQADPVGDRFSTGALDGACVDAKGVVTASEKTLADAKKDLADANKADADAYKTAAAAVETAKADVAKAKNHRDAVCEEARKKLREYLYGGSGSGASKPKGKVVHRDNTGYTAVSGGQGPTQPLTDPRVDGLRSDVDGLKSDVSGLRSDVDGLKSDVSSTRTEASAFYAEYRSANEKKGHAGLFDGNGSLDLFVEGFGALTNLSANGGGGFGLALNFETIDLLVSAGGLGENPWGFASAVAGYYVAGAVEFGGAEDALGLGARHWATDFGASDGRPVFNAVAGQLYWSHHFAPWGSFQVGGLVGGESVGVNESNPDMEGSHLLYGGFVSMRFGGAILR